MPIASLLFDRFELQPAQRRLLRDNVPIVLRARAFDLLLALAERAGSLVTKSELLDLVWPGLVVEENNIAAQIVVLRKAIGGERIATVPGLGYRFTAEVRRVPDESDGVADVRSLAPQSTVSSASTRAVDALIGRDADMATLQASLREAHCVTLVGAGGVGKTVLAKAAAADNQGTGMSLGEPAWVDLAALDEGASLAAAVCRALNVAAAGSPSEIRSAIANALKGSPRLLVLDNAEHLVEAVASFVAELLDAVPAVSVLVTSQVPLRIRGERVQALDPLAVPSEDSPDEQALSASSVRLLIERVRNADPRFVPGAGAAMLLRRICTRLDGLPLALEMAAAIVPLLGLSGVLDALDQRFAALRRGARGAPERHQTLRAALEWSHDLLQPSEQRVFCRLGVFASSFSLELAVTAAGDEGEDRWAVIDAMASLVERSLVTTLHADPPRYRLLETMRSFALERLAASGLATAVHARAASGLHALLTQGQEGALDPLAAAELANVPELLAWARAHMPAVAIDLAMGAARVATWTPWLGEAAGWIEVCEPLLTSAIPLDRQAAWWRELARFQSFVRGARTVEAARRAGQIERQLGDNPSGLFLSLVPLLRARVLTPDEFEEVRKEAQALLDNHPEWPDRHRILFSGSLAMEYRRRGDFESAWRHQKQEAEQAERAGLYQIADNAYSNLAATLVGLGRYDEALRMLSALLERSGAAENPVNAHNRVQRLNALIGLERLDDAQQVAADGLAWCRRFDVLDIHQVLALLAARQGRPRVAAMLVGYHEACLKRRDAALPVDTHAPWRVTRLILERSLDESVIDGLMERGARLSDAEADRLLFESAGA